MSCVELNFARKFFCKLNEFRACEKYTDVTIECDSTRFRCHRLALAVTSDYFDAMFRNDFRENVDENIVLRDVDAKTFDLVLQFLYTGKLVIDTYNVYDLLRIGDFLGIEGLEELCVRFVAQNLRSVNVLDLFIFACMTGKSVLIEMLGQRDMTEQLEQFFEEDAHLEISFDVFSMILKQWKATSQDAIVRWVNSSIEKRRQYFDDLVKLHAVSTIANFSTSLYVYLKYTHSAKTFVINQSRSKNCSFLQDIGSSEQHGIVSEPVVLDDSRIFVLRNYTNPEFVMSTSIDMHPISILKPPPIVGSDFVLCNMLNQGIYLYDKNLYCNPNRYVDYGLLSEIRRGIFFYNCEVNGWFHVPPMKTRLKYACMTVLDNMLYLIGGEKTSGYVQAYDHRTEAWQEIPKTKFNYVEAACCTLNDRIYVCGGGRSRRKAERLNFVAGKWEKIESTHMEVDHGVHMVPYANQLWALHNARGPRCLHIDVYDPRLNTWCISSILRETSDRILPQDYFMDIEATVVFKSS